MADFYDEMRGVADDLLGEFKQGSVQLRRVTTTPGPNEWDPPTETTETWELKAAVRRVHQRYEDGVLIVQTGDVVTFAVTAMLIIQNDVPVDPPVPVDVTDVKITDSLVIDGRVCAITNPVKIPGAGTVVAWKVFCAA
ncbi:hypothetical protein ACHMW4_03575 [Mesorhizobium sp. UC22_110]|uniref:hypothetical protein n=1 Tax=unclassified Mesorhizobium TaxID=325217 RepID=UPI0036733256